MLLEVTLNEQVLVVAVFIAREDDAAPVILPPGGHMLAPYAFTPMGHGG
jgi:hypothetical protein